MSGLILIQTVWHSNGTCISERFFSSNNINGQQKNMQHYPACKELNSMFNIFAISKDQNLWMSLPLFVGGPETARGLLRQRMALLLDENTMCTNKLCTYTKFWSLLKDNHQGAQWLSGRVLDSRPKGRGFEPHRRHCVVVLEQDTFILA